MLFNGAFVFIPSIIVVVFAITDIKRLVHIAFYFVDFPSQQNRIYSVGRVKLVTGIQIFHGTISCTETNNGINVKVVCIRAGVLKNLGVRSCDIMKISVRQNPSFGACCK
ncbi:hypothetical protein D3C80_1174850 [compost metagenome]